MSSSSKKRILSIQSHVVSGYVGNKSAIFPLQILGFDCDVVNSVHFSNHTGYAKGFEGDVLKGEQLRAILDGLKRNELLDDIGHVLTGYIGSASFLEAVLDVIHTLRQQDSTRRTVRYVCDPVLGDEGKFYVPPELVDLYREKVIPLADVLTPNQFEAEQLAGVTIQSLDDAKHACNLLHDKGPRLIFITSFVTASNNTATTTTDGPEPPDRQTMAILASERSIDGSSNVCWKIDCPILPRHFTGTGDLCAALLLAHSAVSNDIPKVMERVFNTMYAVLERTHEAAGDSNSIRSRELRLIQSKDLIECPPERFRAERI